MAKIHLQSNKVTAERGNSPIAMCASRLNSKGRINYNSRRTYATMNSVIARGAEFAATPAANRCAHCMDILQERRTTYPNTYALVCN